MGCHLYCIVPRGHVPPRDLYGIDGAQVRTIETEAVAAWYSMLDAPPEPSIARIRSHDRVTKAAMRDSVTPLPARFGQWLADASALSAVISASAPEYAAALASVAGAAEFGITLLDATSPAVEERPTPAPAGSPGRAYLRELALRHGRSRRAEERGERLLRDLASALGPLVRQERSTTPRGDGALARVAHLVDRREADAYAASVRSFREGNREVRTVLTGPWPPYSFGP